MKRVLFILILACPLWAQKQPFELSTVDKLRSTGSSKLDPALPPQFFGKWFRRLVNPTIPEYAVRDCDSATTTASAGAAKPQCIYATASLPPTRIVTLKFLVDSAHNSFQYLEGTIGPSDPASKQPTKAIKKLSDLPGMIHPE